MTEFDKNKAQRLPKVLQATAELPRPDSYIHALLVSRLSVLTDATTSPERQIGHVTHEAERRNLKVIEVAEDLDISAVKYPPWERPSLGPWFTDPAKVKQWDTLIFWKFDRLVRNVSDLATLIIWCDLNGRNLISVTEPFDLTNPIGRAMAQIIGVFAELEAAMISDRVRDAHQTMKRTNRYGGGMVPFGHIAIPLENGGWTIRLDPQYAPVLLDAIERIISGESMSSIVTEWNTTGIPTTKDIMNIRSGGRKEPRGRKWDVKSFKNILRSRLLVGEAEFAGEVVHNEALLPAKRSDPLISIEKFDQLQRALDALSHGQTDRRKNSTPLLQVAFCGLCGMPEYYMRTARGTYGYYQCGGKARSIACRSRAAKESDVHDALERWLLPLVGGIERTTERILEGEDHSAEVERVDRAIAIVRAERDTGFYEDDDTGYLERLAKLFEKRQKFLAIPQRLSETVHEGTGETYRTWWERSTWHERGAWLRALDVQILVSFPKESNEPGFQFKGSDALKELFAGGWDLAD
jgi:DNA invertase Pin-like site-specific DNA recombinase